MSDEPHMYPLPFYRFDIYGLSPNANEDEAGIKRASENSMLKEGF